MVSDAIHTASDVVSTFIVIVSVKIASRRSDSNHQYGHERFESLGSLLLSLMLMATGLGIGYSGLKKIFSAQSELAIPGDLALYAAFLSIVGKEAMYWYTIIAANRINSEALKADAWHHRSDAISSIGALIGLWIAKLGYSQADPLASLLISAALAFPEFYLFLSQSMTTGRVLVGGTLIIVGIVGLILFCRKNTKLREMLAHICSFRFAKTFAFSTFLYFMAFAINCLTMLLALYAIRPFTSLSTLPLVFAMGTLAWLVGYVTPGAPGGIGIREVVLSTMAAHTEFGDIILVAAVGQRFMFIASDFVAYLLGNILYKAPSVTTEPTPQK